MTTGAEVRLTDDELDALETARELTRHHMEIWADDGFEDVDWYLRTHHALREIENLLQDHGRRPRRWATERYSHAFDLDPAASTA